MKSPRLLLSLATVTALSACGLPDLINRNGAYNYATISHASKHLDAKKDFNENNPGVGLGSEAPLRGSKWSVGVEGGYYENSNSNTSIYAVGYFERDVLVRKPRALRVGFFTGYARYPNEAANSDSIFPTIGDYIPVAGLQATIPTVGPHEFRVRVSPGLSRSSAIVSLQSNFVF